MNRRTFAAGALAAATAPALCARHLKVDPRPVNLVPETHGDAPNYWCTWSLQNYMYGQGRAPFNIAQLEDDSGARLARKAMDESNLLGEKGWARDFFPSVRSELYLLLDDGWESDGNATFLLDENKFPSFRGAPAERLRSLNQTIQHLGWRSTAVWCRNTPGGQRDEQLETLSQQAAIPYWKVDIGDPSFHLTELAQSTGTHLRIEHVHGESPLNGDWKVDGRFGAQTSGSRRQQILAHTDVYRTYDVTSILSLPTTIDRLAEMLNGAQGNSRIEALLNVEDEVYLAAAMGCTMGVMRHPLQGKRADGDVDLFLNGPRQPKRRLDEVARALRWQRLAAPFAAGYGSVQLSGERLTDGWHFVRGESWDSSVVGHTAYQSAPALLARGMALPEVRSRGEKPFICAARFPNGAASVYAGERTHPGTAWRMPNCDICVPFADAPGPYAIFGAVRSFTLEFQHARAPKRLFAQDLLASNAVDITHMLTDNGRRLTLSEGDLRRIGLQAATPGDLSAPGMVMAWV